MTVFRIDVENAEVEASRNYGSYPWDTIDYAYVGSRLWIDPYNGDLYTVTQGAMWVVDTETLDRARTFRPASYGFLHNNGAIYLARDPQVWEYWAGDERATAIVALRDESVEQGAEQTIELSGFGPGELLELWSRPDAVLLGTVNADEQGSASFTFDASMQLGEATVQITRVSTRGLLAARYDVVEAGVPPNTEPPIHPTDPAGSDGPGSPGASGRAVDSEQSALAATGAEGAPYAWGAVFALLALIIGTKLATSRRMIARRRGIDLSTNEPDL